MTDELVSVRAIFASESRADHDVFRQAALASSLPVEIVSAGDAAMVCRLMGERTDLVFLDAGIASADIARVVSATRAVTPRPFTVLLAPTGSDVPFETDALATKASGLDEAIRLIQGSAHVRLPSSVLVVDDSATMRSIVRKILLATRFPFKVSEAAEGFAALQLLGRTAFDIVFLDYNMPGINGLETLAEFKREKRRVSVVVMTSSQEMALAERVEAEGAAFLKKPFFPADIEAVLCRHYGLRAFNPKRG
jgi:CheY-like chemotaxis protein